MDPNQIGEQVQKRFFRIFQNSSQIIDKKTKRAISFLDYFKFFPVLVSFFLEWIKECIQTRRLLLDEKEGIDNEQPGKTKTAKQKEEEKYQEEYNLRK